MSGSLEITDNRVKVIQQYHQLKDLIYEIADTAGIDLTGVDTTRQYLVANTILRNFLGDKSYNKYIENLKLPSSQLN